MLIRPLAALALVLALAGCTAAPETLLPTPTLTAAPTILNPDLVPMALGVVTGEKAAAESTRLVDALQALIDPATILNVSDQSQLVPNDDDVPGFYGAYRTISLDPEVDALGLSQTIAAVLGQSSWVIQSETNEGGQYLAAISYGPPGNFWFALIGGDVSVSGQSVVTFQLASPDVVA